MPETKLAAVIDIGSTAIRMLVAEIFQDGTWKTLDRLDRGVKLGTEAFTTGRIERETMAEAIQVLLSYRELIDGWRIPDENIAVFATSAIREATNSDTFVDRVEMRTGFRIDIIEKVEANRLTYIAVAHALRDLRSKTARSNMMIVEVGGGTTDVIFLRRNQMATSHSTRVGSLRVAQQIEQARVSYADLQRHVEDGFNDLRITIEPELKTHPVRYFAALGGDVRIAAVAVGEAVHPQYSIIKRTSFDEFIEKLKTMRPDRIAENLRIPYADAEVLLPSLVITRMFLERTEAMEIFVPLFSIREGLLIDRFLESTMEFEEDSNLQVVNSALSLGRKYAFDEKHAVAVSRTAVRLFELLSAEHGLDGRKLLLLQTAAVLHDIGLFINSSGHHKHGQYIVSNSEIFGLTREKRDLVAHIIRYHRKSAPLPSHLAFHALRREERLVIMKLAALLRLANALDASHQQKVELEGIERGGDEIRLAVSFRGDCSAEVFALRQKAQMFEEVFGLRVSLTGRKTISTAGDSEDEE